MKFGRITQMLLSLSLSLSLLRCAHAADITAQVPRAWRKQARARVPRAQTHRRRMRRPERRAALSHCTCGRESPLQCIVLRCVCVCVCLCVCVRVCVCVLVGVEKGVVVVGRGLLLCIVPAPVAAAAAAVVVCIFIAEIESLLPLTSFTSSDTRAHTCARSADARVCGKRRRFKCNFIASVC